MIVGLVLSWFFIGAGFWLGWQLLRQNGRMLLHLDELQKRLDALEFGEESEPAGLPLDSAAPEFDLLDLAGRRHTLAQYRGEPLLLIFFNPACGFCRELMPKLARLEGERSEAGVQRSESSQSQAASAVLDSRPRTLIITSGGAEKNQLFFAQSKLDFPILIQTEMEVTTAYQANGTPTGYLIDKKGNIASQLAVGAEGLLALAEGDPHPGPLSYPMGEGGPGPGEGDRATRFASRSLDRSKIKRDGLKAGTSAPNFRLPRVDGRGELSLEESRGRRVLLVFSAPHCGPCQMLAPQLEAFHREQREISVVLISRGDPKENRTKIEEHGLTFPVVLQQQWEISRLYGMFTTPMAYLIDEAGIIAKDVAVGVGPILTLMAQAKTAPR